MPPSRDVRRELERLDAAGRGRRAPERADRARAAAQRGARARARAARAAQRALAELSRAAESSPFRAARSRRCADEYERAAAELRAAELAAAAAETELAARARPRSRRADAGRAELGRAAARSASSTATSRLHEELDRAYTDLRTDLNLPTAPGALRAGERVPRELTDGRYSELELDDQYNIVVLEDGDPKAGHLGRRGGSGEPRAATGDLAR